MKCGIAFGKEGTEGDLVHVGGGAEDAPGFLAPIGVEAGLLEFLLDERESLKEKLALVGKRKSVLTGNAAGELVDEYFAEGDVDGSGGLKIADRAEKIGGDHVAIGDSTHLAKEMMMAEAGVAGIDGIGAALTVGAEVLATA